MFKEGEAFLKSQGVEVTDDDVKTRGQKELLSEIVTPQQGTDEGGLQGDLKEQQQQDEETTEEKPKVTRKGTMAVTAEVCGCLFRL